MSGRPLQVTPTSQNVYSTLAAPKLEMKAVDKLLKFVAEGEQDKAEKMIKKDKSLLLAAGTVTDLSKREFKQITAFQYALWALDWRMWKMIQKYLPEEAQTEQFAALESKGTVHGKHFSLKPLTDALQTYVDNTEKVWKYDHDHRAKNHWQTVVGGAQRLLPAHVVNEYCHPTRSFSPCPEFTEDVLPRSRACEVFDGSSKNVSKYVKGEWFTSKSDGGSVGDSFAYGRCYLPIADGCNRGRWGVPWVADDLKTLQFLSKIRIQQLRPLASHLNVSLSSFKPTQSTPSDQSDSKLTKSIPSNQSKSCRIL